MNRCQAYTAERRKCQRGAQHIVVFAARIFRVCASHRGEAFRVGPFQTPVSELTLPELRSVLPFLEEHLGWLQELRNRQVSYAIGKIEAVRTRIAELEEGTP